MPATRSLVVRESTSDDLAAIESLYPSAFPEEDLVPLVQELLQDVAIRLSLVAEVNGNVVGHVIFTRCRIEGTEADAALLAPLAVGPAYQQQGIGSQIVRRGLEKLGADGVKAVFVLGDPAYYGRLGFRAEAHVAAPYELPEEWSGAWQSRYLDGSRKQVTGMLNVPPQWQRRELWLP